MSNFEYYVVWEGRQTGVYKSWADCKKQVENHPHPRYKGFMDKQAAYKAFNQRNKRNSKKQLFRKIKDQKRRTKAIQNRIADSISVDGACDTITGAIEYQAVHTATKEVIFKAGPFEDGTNNIAEFLALVEAIKYCKSEGLSIPIYSDSQTALSWVKNKSTNTKHPRSDNNQQLFKLFDEAEQWIKQNDYSNAILKWETKSWGENPADFGRK